MRTMIIAQTKTMPRWSYVGGALLAAAIAMPSAAGIIIPRDPVNLRSAEDFVILAKTGVSTTGTTAIVGNIGVSPAAATYLTGFDLIMDASGTFSGSSLVTGKFYASDYTDPTPTKMTAAIGDMETAYTDAAGRITPDFSELLTGDITGQTLTPGLYTWSTGVLISGGGLTLSGSSTDIFILQVAQNLEVANDAIVTLAGGVSAENIFWQVAGNVSIGTAAQMQGIILCQTDIALNTGASLNGRAYAQTAVTLDANAVSVSQAVAITDLPGATLAAQSAQSFRNNAIVFTTPANGTATLSLLNLRGQEVAVLFNGDVQAGTVTEVALSAQSMAPGCYLSRLECSGAVLTQRILIP